MTTTPQLHRHTTLIMFGCFFFPCVSFSLPYFLFSVIAAGRGGAALRGRCTATWSLIFLGSVEMTNMKKKRNGIGPGVFHLHLVWVNQVGQLGGEGLVACFGVRRISRAFCCEVSHGAIVCGLFRILHTAL